MRQDWIDFLARQGAGPDAENFGQPAAELAAARNATVFAPLPDFGLIRATGEEAATFLHNLLTNDVQKIAADALRFAGLCTAKGRLIASFHIWHDSNQDLLLMLSADILPGILKKLSMYVLRSKVKLSDASDERVLFGLAGPGAEALVQELGASLPPPTKTAAFAHGQVLRLADGRCLLAVAADAAPTVWATLATKASPVGTAAWRSLEIAAGQPRIVAATQEAFVPQMVNMELADVGGVSFTKGCYPGQEIVARTQYLGKIKRRMYRARLESAVPPGTSLYAPETGDQHCGTVVTIAPATDGGQEALVVVQSSCAEAGEIHVGALNGPVLALLSLPYTVG